MDERIYEYLLALPKESLINLMWLSLDEMKAYNGRTRTFCIMSALGADCVEGDDGRMRYRLPSKERARENTASMGL